MAQKVLRRCLQCNTEYYSLSAKAWCCGDPNCYKRWHKARQKLHLSTKEYKDICIQKQKDKNNEDSGT